MNYRILPPEEWGRASHLFEENGQRLPDPRMASIAAAEDFDGTIAGVLVVQVAVHLEPLIIKNPRVDFRRLQSTIEANLEKNKGMAYYCFTDTDKMARIAEIGGFERIGDFWRKEVR
jgi:hypothetical protein